MAGSTHDESSRRPAFHHTDWAFQWLDESASSGGDIDKPSFLYMAHNAPHWPLHAHPEDIAKYKGVYDGGYEDGTTVRTSLHPLQTCWTLS